MTRKISAKQGYCIMIDYFNNYCQQNLTNELQFLLGDMLFLENGKTFDPAAWEDWLDAINKVKSSKINHLSHKIEFSIEDAYLSMVEFLEGYTYRTNSEEIRELLDKKMKYQGGKPVDTKNWNEWIASVEKVLAQDPLVLPRLVLYKE